MSQKSMRECATHDRVVCVVVVKQLDDRGRPRIRHCSLGSAFAFDSANELSQIGEWRFQTSLQRTYPTAAPVLLLLWLHFRSSPHELESKHKGDVKAMQKPKLKARSRLKTPANPQRERCPRVVLECSVPIGEAFELFATKASH